MTYFTKVCIGGRTMLYHLLCHTYCLGVSEPQGATLSPLGKKIYEQFCISYQILILHFTLGNSKGAEISL